MSLLPASTAVATAPTASAAVPAAGAAVPAAITVERLVRRRR
jgi:hypothetical protein